MKEFITKGKVELISQNLGTYIGNELIEKSAITFNLTKDDIEAEINQISVEIEYLLLDNLNIFSENKSNTVNAIIDLLVKYLADPMGKYSSQKEKLDYIRDEEYDTLKRLNYGDKSTFKFFETPNWNEIRVETLELILLNAINDNYKTLKFETPVNILTAFNPILYESILRNPSILKAMNWRIFEKLLADILEKFGYEIELMQGTKDGGIDIIAFKNKTDFGIHKYILQAKRWNNKVGVEPVRSLAFLHAYEKATKSCLVTTSDFTRGAWNLANSYQWQLELKNFNSLLDWVRIARSL